MTGPTKASGDATRLSLISRARRRDADAWRELVALYGPLIGHWCRRFGLDPHQTADCAQDVFQAVASALEGFEHRRRDATFRGWLWVIARNKIRDHVRRVARQTSAAGGSSAMRRLHAIAAPEVPEDDPTDRAVWNGVIRRALAQVRSEFEPRSWQAFWRSAVDEIPTAVVAEELGVTAAAVRQSRSRILRRLRQQLGDLP